MIREEVSGAPERVYLHVSDGDDCWCGYHFEEDGDHQQDRTLVAYVREQPWQPIETAPRDGRTLLLGYFNSSDKWRTLRGQWFSDEAIGEWENGNDFEAGWYETSVEADELPNVWVTNPTHWMPLPASPMGDK